MQRAVNKSSSTAEMLPGHDQSAQDAATISRRLLGQKPGSARRCDRGVSSRCDSSSRAARRQGCSVKVSLLMLDKRAQPAMKFIRERAVLRGDVGLLARIGLQVVHSLISRV